MKKCEPVNGPHAKIRVLVVDDHPMMRQGFKATINAEADMMVCGEADSSATALEKVAALKPDLATVDLNLKNSNGLELLKDLQVRYPDLRVLVVSMYDEAFYAERVLRAGARGYLTKEAGTDRLVQGIREVMLGKPCVSDSVATRIISRSMGGPARQVLHSPSSLSDRELQVLEYIGSGFASGEIAEKLHLSVKTIESHRENIKQKLKVTSGAQLVKYAFHWVQSKEWPGAETEGRAAKPKRTRG
jgi:DNA-binding NarL/FixJ family response regulator